MKPQNLIGIALCAILFSSQLAAQDKSTNKFGKVTVADFSPQSPAIDSGSDAVVLADVGSSEFEGNTRGEFTLVFKRHERILIKNRNAFDEATVKMYIYSGLSIYEEKFEDFEAATYNLQNGQITETKLDKTAIFKEKYNKDYSTIKFTLSEIKEGSIIDYKFTIKSPFNRNDVRSWSFQGKYPSLWSEYKVTIPPVYSYISLPQGYLPFAIDTSGKTFKSYSIIESGDASSQTQIYTITGDARWERWVMKDIPAFKNEQYLSSSKNYIAKIKFQLHSIHYSDNHVVPVLKSWYTVAEDLLKNPDFGESLGDRNGWLEDDLKAAVKGSQGLERAKNIYGFVRDNFTCTDDDDRYLSQPLKKTFQTKKGNVVDLNMLLTAMLIEQGFEAHPVLLSTRDNGRNSETSALLNQYNYVVSRVKIDSSFYLLDASVNRLGFGKLPEKCYNGSGRLIDKTPILVPISTDSLSEEKNTLIFVVNDEKDGVTGSMTSNLGYYQSLAVRDKLAKIKTSDYIREMTKAYSTGIEVSNVHLDSLKTYEQPICIRNDLKMKFDEDIVYFNPILSDTWKNNPFSAASRSYPVEMPYKMNETYVLNMEVPKGYKVDEIPKSVRIKLNETDGMFEYLMSNNGDNIQFRCRLVINKANFMPDDYNTLRDFFGYVVKKEAEQIVFTKAK